jgi:sec-independent protein translocase protein TatA
MTMESFSLSHWLIVVAVVLIVCGSGRMPNAMGDLARGIRGFRAHLRDESAAEDDGLAETADRGRV